MPASTTTTTTTTITSPRARQSAYFSSSPSTTPSRRKRSFIPDSKSSSAGEVVIIEAGPPIPKLDFSCQDQALGYCIPSRRSAFTSPRLIEQVEAATNKRRKLDSLPGQAQLQPLNAEIQQTLPVVVVKEKKARKKSNKTVTARAIARYTHAEEPSRDSKTSPHFVAEVKEKVQAKSRKRPTKDTVPKQRKPRKRVDSDKSECLPKANTKAKPKLKPKPRPKQASPAAPKLASPKQHSARLQRQEILFGTSSQLNSHESADYIRDMQQALGESEAASCAQQKETFTLRPSKSRAVRQARGSLWAQSTHGHLPTELSGASKMNGTEPPEPNFGEVDLAKDSLDTVTYEDQSFMDIDTLCPVKIMETIDSIYSPAPSPTACTPPSYQSSLPSARPSFHIPPVSASFNLSRTALRPMSTNSKPTRATLGTNTPEKSPTRIRVPTRTNEEPKSPTAKSPRGTIRTPVEPGHIVPKRRGRPPKSPVTKAGALQSTPQKQSWPPAQVQESDDSFDAIEDLELVSTPSPPRRKPGSPLQVPKLPLTAAVTVKSTTKRSNTNIVNTLHPRWPEVQAKLFPQISTVVQSSPPSRNVKAPSWHEKMLMYDPIVLEDLTEWLNKQGLRVEGKDEELVMISAWMVQIWCESNSICCLWKEGLRGGVRTRY